MRFTWEGDNCRANQAQWLVIGTTSQSSQATCTIVKEDNKLDGSLEVVSTSTLTGDSNPHWIKTVNKCPELSEEGKQASGRTSSFFRITFSRTSAAGTVLALSGIKYLTARWGNQGCGSELEYPYIWDEFANIYPIKTNAQLLGTTSKRWSTIYGVDANFSGSATISGNTTIGGTLTVGTTSAKRATTLNGTLTITDTTTAQNIVSGGTATTTGRYDIGTSSNY